MMSTPFPPLRPVDAVPVEHEGQTLFCLNDPAGYVDEQLLLSPGAFFLAANLDGRQDLRDIQGVFARHFRGTLIREEQVLEVVRCLDEHGFLLNERFEARRREVEEAFRQQETRVSTLAGKGYPADPDTLRRFLDGFFTETGGTIPAETAPGDGAPPQPCLIVPHIDYPRGGAAYAHGYRSLYGQGRPDTVFVFGVAHAGVPVPFSLTRKHFETPFGLVKTNRELAERLEAACDWDPYAWEYVHRNEHSIELQVVMLAYLYGTQVQIVPILCSAFSEDPEMSHPETIAGVRRFLDACREIAAEPEQRVSVIAGADLAHRGKRFGDPFDIDDAVIAAVAERDREDLEHVTRSDAGAFYASVMRDQNERKVCGLGCIYAALKTVEGRTNTAELLHYGYAHDPAGGIVSFASIGLS